MAVGLRNELHELGNKRTATENQLHLGIRNAFKKECKTHSQIISRLSFGVWVNLAKLLILDWKILVSAMLKYLMSRI